MSFPHYTQPDAMDCGPTCIRIIAKYYGKSIGLPILRQMTHTSRMGSSMLGLSKAAELLGFRSMGVKVSFAKLHKDATLPCIVHWKQNHFVVVYKITSRNVYVSDPAGGKFNYSVKEFIANWISPSASPYTEEGICLLLQPKPDFYHAHSVINREQSQNSYAYLFQYLRPYKGLFFNLILTFLAASILQLFLPFLTQNLIDEGIQKQNIHFIWLVLFAQLAIFLGKCFVDVIRSWLLLHVSSRVNISLVTDFFIKLMALPIRFFDLKMSGDLMQRISDQQRIETFLTRTSIEFLFSIFNAIVFGMILAWYDLRIFLVFIIGSIFYLLWVVFFLKYRRTLNHQHFEQSAKTQQKIMEIIGGMQEIKLNNAERIKRWHWETLQVKLFKLNVRSLTVEKTQSIGSSLIHELKNMLITILTAKLVMDGKMTIGMLVSVNFIIGQLNGPILQLIGFIQQWQDAKISIERLNEINNKPSEEKDGSELTQMPTEQQSLKLENVSFRYNELADDVLKNISITIQANKVTAIVGSSGSGKTTLIKLLMKFYEPTTGKLLLGSIKLSSISHHDWRNSCGVVMQEGFVFNDSIAGNIAIDNDNININTLENAAKMANVNEFIETLPLTYNTKIGNDGLGVSTGQKQRILIARAIYKNPDYLFFDEATSNLDTANEKIISENLATFYKNKTVLIIAHRLSTVKDADTIIVLDKGEVVEQGTHIHLVNKRGYYYNLVKNQLNLGN